MSAAVDPDRSEWDVIVIGGGAAGENAAQYATQFSGLEAVIVEADLLGGECSYWACMPSKALLRPVEVLSIGRDLPGVKALLGDRPLDAQAVLARRDEVVNHLDDSSQVEWALGVGIDVVRGYGRLSGVREVTVTGPDGAERVLTARHAVVLDTGSVPAIPPVPGLAEARPWTSRDVTNMHEAPRRMVVVGGGVVACESVTWLHALGVEEITVIEGAPGLLVRNEPFAGEMIRSRFAEAGITVRTGTKVTSAQRAEVNDAPVGHRHGGEVTVTLDTGEQVSADEILVAAGRQPNSEDIGLETVGLKAGGYLPVDDHLNVEGVEGDWLYAIGDLCGRALLTHMGKYQARIAGEVIAARAAGRPLDSDRFGRHTDVADHNQVPQVTFTDPEIGSVGLTEQQARDQGLDVEAVEYDLAALAGSYVLRENYYGRAKLVIDSQRDVVVGATFVGTGVAELTHSATMAVVARIPVPVLRHVVPSYPTLSEVWLRLLEELGKQRQDAR
ncbi:MAG TPA: NAD(P)/FAD-dependent oxidoreductase [Jatrophihabitans sp.]|jgi:dihydrolipoamide dehydrogenase|uniref:dihydrolipoyl dehydrogenase family protein n=1 Tax=Jatrophihabitans sp. TaxID=1932789 RepID=UPI002EDD8587